MKQSGVSNQAVERLKSVFMLGLTSNMTTFAGLLLIWILTARSELVSGFLNTLLTVLAFTPTFMADAINHYCLGRIKLEHIKGWDDIQITPESRSQIAHHYQLFRIASIVPSYLLAASALSALGLASAEIELNLRLAFLAAFILHFARATWFLHHCVAPRLPGYGGRKLFWRSSIAILAFAGWFGYYSSQVATLSEKSVYSASAFIFLSGVFYFFLNAFMHPLPTRYSLLRPGKVTRREVFFAIEVLDQEQFAALNGVDAINAAAEECRRVLHFEKISNIRMPLLELPLFQAWGNIFIDASGKTAMLILDSEVARGVHRSLISFVGDSIFITTDFGAPQAKFPPGVTYCNLNRNLSATELMQKHQQQLGSADPDNIRNSVCLKLEHFVKSMIKFLEKDANANKIKPENTGEINESNSESDNG